MIDLQFEEAVLGAFILEAKNCRNEIETCRTEWFYHLDHQKIFSAIKELSLQEGTKIDALTIWHKCKPDIDAYFITQLTNRVSNALHIEYHMRVLQQLYVGREFQKACRSYAETSPEDPFAAMADIKSKIEALSITPGDNTRSLEQIHTQRVEDLERRRQSDVKIIGHPTGFNKFDHFIGGFVPGEFIVIAGRPSMGKTAFAVNLAMSHCRYNGRVLMFSIEMPAEQISDRVSAAGTGIDGLRIRAAELDDYDMQKIATLDLPKHFYINDNVRLDIDSMAAIIRNYKEKYQITAVFIDYLQLIKSVDKRNREQEIAYISRRCKQIAKEYGVCVVALAQLNREADRIIPTMAHLRESGAIEQDADTVLFPYRPDKDNRNRGETENAQLIIEKCRNGKTGILEMWFHSPTIQYKWQ